MVLEKKNLVRRATNQHPYVCHPEVNWPTPESRPDVDFFIRKSTRIMRRGMKLKTSPCRTPVEISKGSEMFPSTITALLELLYSHDSALTALTTTSGFPSSVVSLYSTLFIAQFYNAFLYRTFYTAFCKPHFLYRILYTALFIPHSVYRTFYTAFCIGHFFIPHSVYRTFYTAFSIMHFLYRIFDRAFL